MKVQIKILGVGPRKRGIGKNSGEPYDFTEVSVLLPSWKMFAGEVGCICVVDQSVLEGHDQLFVGSTYWAEVIDKNFRPAVVAIYE